MSPLSRLPLGALGCLAAVVVLAGCDDAGSTDEGLPPPERGQLVLHFDESPDGAIANTGSGDFDIDAAVLNGGGLSEAPSPTTDAGAIETPDFADDAAAPAAIIRVTNAGTTDELDPGRGDFSFGADIRVDPDSEGPAGTDNGNNVMQRGLFEGAQYKLQLDHDALSCRIKGDAGDVTVTSDEPIESDHWYRLACERSGDTVTLEVTDMETDDPSPVRNEQAGATGSLTPAEPTLPLSVGGKLNADGEIVTDGTDQFNGRIDNVYLDIS